MKDYAYPTLMAEKCLKEMHYAVLAKDMGRASEMCAAALIWVMRVQEALREMSSETKS